MGFSDSWADTFRGSALQAPLLNEHPLLDAIRTTITKYRQDSPFHFAVQIDVQADTASPVFSWEITMNLKLKVLFIGYHTAFHKTCRPVFRESSFSGKVEVEHKRNGWISLENMLSVSFPPSKNPVDDDTLRIWWGENGKSFNWSKLPTELKDHVFQFCVHPPQELTQFIVGTSAHRTAHRYIAHRRGRGIYEVTSQLGEWKSLPHVSRQIRAIVLRLLLIRNDIYDGGLSIVSLHAGHLNNVIRRLGYYYQMQQTNSIPRTRKEEVLARQYLHFPKQHPGLNQYATMGHSIRKIFLQFDFLDSMHFWKVSVAGFDLYRPKHFITCDVLETLPNLEGVFVRLPFIWWRDQPTQRSPRLFHEFGACPRTLHRFIYTRVAEVLAPYEKVGVDKFFDRQEEQEFRDLHQAAVSALRFTKKDLDELYEDCKGGIELDLEMDTNTNASATMSSLTSKHFTRLSSQAHGVNHVEGIENVFPPQCLCEVPCFEAFQDIGNY